MSRSDGKALRALIEEMRVKAAMIELGEKIAWGSDFALLRKGADALDSLLSASSCEAGWTVKPLEWTSFDRFSTARCVMGVYGIGPWYEVSGKWTVRLSGKEFAQAPSEEAAKAAAQADYESRIRSAIVPAPPSPGEGG